MMILLGISPFQGLGLVMWRCHNSSEGRYHLAMGLRPFRAWMLSIKTGRIKFDNDKLRPFRAWMLSREGDRYTNDGCSLSDRPTWITSPEGV